MPVQNVILEFTTDTSKLAPAEERLKGLGKIDQQQSVLFKNTNAELTRRTLLQDKLVVSQTKEQAAYNKSIASFKNLGAAAKQATEKLFKLDLKGIVSDFTSAANEAKKYKTEVGGVAVESAKLEGSSGSLRQQLKSVRQEMELLKIQGKDNTDQYRILEKQSGSLKDAIGDVAAEIKNASSDTRGFDNLIGSAQAVAGGFAVAQGTAALFGDETEQLQETLLKVNAAMAILQGLQGIQNALQKEGALIKLADSIQTKAQVAATVLYTFVMGGATTATKVFRAALLATGIGAAVVLVGFLVSKIIELSEGTSKQTKLQNALNDALKQTNDTVIEQAALYVKIKNEGVEQLQRQLALEKASHSEDGKTLGLRKQIADQQAKNAREGLQQLGLTENKLIILEGAYARVTDKISALNDLRTKAGTNKMDLKVLETLSETYNKEREATKSLLDAGLQYQKDIVQAQQEGLEIRLEEAKQGLSDQLAVEQAGLNSTLKNTKENFNAQRRVARAEAAIAIKDAGDNGAKILEARTALQSKLRDIDIEAAKVRHEDRLTAINIELLDAQKQSKAINQRTSQAEIDAQIKQIQENAVYEIEQEKRSEDKRIEIRKTALAAITQLQKDFNQQSSKETIEDLISRNNAELAQVDITDKEKIDLQIENVINQAQIEIDANKGLSDKIKEIIAKRNEDIRLLKLAAIEKEVEDEIELENDKNGYILRGLQSIVDNTKKSAKLRIAALELVTQSELNDNQKRIDALNKEFEDKLISQKEYNKRYAKLVDEQNKIVEAGAKKRKEILTEEQKEQIGIAFEIADKLKDVFSNIFSAQSDAEQQRIQEQKDNVDVLLEAGNITAKEADKRKKKLEVQEKLAKQREAQREKAIASFEALLSIPRAFLQGLTKTGGGPILGAIYAGIAAVEAAIIISRPVPKFGKGKKDRYEGPGEVAETGTEIVEKGGRMYVVKKKSFVWLGAEDKVYNPSETQKILQGTSMPVDTKLVSEKPNGGNSAFTMDYQRLGKAVADNIPEYGLSIDENGFTEFQKTRNSFNKYLDKRRSFKR